METRKIDFAILGAGALGSILGAHLARSGQTVVMLARGSRAQEIERLGLRITGLVEFCQPVPVLTDVAHFEGAEVFIVATKSYSTDTALEPLRHAEIGTAFSIQNGLVKNEQLAAVWGRGHVLGALANTSGELLPNGEVLFTRNEQLCLGELAGGESARARHIAQIIDGAGIRASCVGDIESLEWSKFAAWAALMVLSVTTRAETWKFLVDPDLALVVARLVREVGALAAARNIDLSDRSPLPISTLVRATEEQAVAAIRALGERLRSTAPGHRMSTLQDLAAGRPLEIDETLGYAVREAVRLSLPLPLLRTAYALIAGINRIRG